MKKEKGLTSIEMVVPLGLAAVLGGMSAMYVTGDATLWPAADRVVASATERAHLDATVAAWNASSFEVVGSDVSLDEADGTALVRDGVILQLGDGDGGGVVVVGLMPEDRDGDGAQDFIDRDRDGRADDFVATAFGETDGHPDLKWQLVSKRFASVGQALEAHNWVDVDVLARSVVPFVTRGSDGASYDTVQFERTEDAHSRIRLNVTQAQSFEARRVRQDHLFYTVSSDTAPAVFEGEVAQRAASTATDRRGARS